MPNDILQGKIEVTGSDGAVVMTWNGETGQASIGGGWFAKPGPQGRVGNLTINDQYGQMRVEINSDATITAGTHGQGGILSLHDSSSPIGSPPRILLNADEKRIVISTGTTANPGGLHELMVLDGKTGDVVAGGNGINPQLALFPADVTAANPFTDKHKATVHLRADDAVIRCGRTGTPGRILVVNNTGAALADIKENGGAASLLLGGNGLGGKIAASDSTGKVQVVIDGQAGDILLGNADCAEEFDLIADERVEPGAVMVLDHEGRLRLSDQPYDRKVAGVLSGAGSFKPGIVLDRRTSAGPRAALAVVGKVYCKVDATGEAIDAGDLLTTSAVPGHAMRAGNPQRAFGAVIGKALASLRSGQGLIPILVALQ
jgi:hypothetical protein